MRACVRVCVCVCVFGGEGGLFFLSFFLSFSFLSVLFLNLAFRAIFEGKAKNDRIIACSVVPVSTAVLWL